MALFKSSRDFSFFYFVFILCFLFSLTSYKPSIAVEIQNIQASGNDTAKEQNTGRADEQNSIHNDTVIVLLSHGNMPTDYPMEKFAQLMALEYRLRSSSGEAKEKMLARYNELDHEIRNWPRTETNDPYKAHVDKLVALLQEKTEMKVISGYNEFCLPTSGEALNKAINTGAKNIIAVTTMLTGGGRHVEVEIPEEIENLKKSHPEKNIIYAWPFDNDTIANLIIDQVRKKSKF